MCAINGVTKHDTALVERMNAATRHRGPDGTGVYTDASVTLGHNRLVIIDLTDAAEQPMRSSDGRFVLVFNGEIYNYRELRSVLEDSYAFKTQSDTEVLLAAFSVWGEQVYAHVKGIFACAVWDTQTETLILARDHMGVKPLYYTERDGVVVFSSELKGVTAALDTPQLDPVATALYLSMQYAPSPHSLVSGVHKVRPGHALTIHKGVIEERSFFADVLPETSMSSLYDTVDAAVGRQLVSDRPVGMFLSGGIDSSIVLHHMSAHSTNVRSYSVAFEMVPGAESEAGKFNADASLAEKTAKVYGATHTTFTISIDDVRALLRDFPTLLDEPVANPTGVSQYLLSKWVRDDGVVVALGGDGGDELFGGYTRHRIAAGAYIFQRLPQVVQRAVGRVHARAGKLGTSFGTPMHMALMAADIGPLSRIIKGNMRINEIVAEHFDARYASYRDSHMHALDTFMHVDRETWLPEESLARSDRSSMSYGLELRVPLLDIDVVRHADTLSPWKKAWPHEGKRVLRAAYAQHLPSYIFAQQKRGWISPGAKWFRDPEINTLAKEVCSSGYYDGLDELIDWDAVHVLLDEHVTKQGYYLYPLWNLFLLNMWARKNMVRFSY